MFEDLCVLVVFLLRSEEASGQAGRQADRQAAVVVAPSSLDPFGASHCFFLRTGVHGSCAVDTVAVEARVPSSLPFVPLRPHVTTYDGDNGQGVHGHLASQETLKRNSVRPAAGEGEKEHCPLVPLGKERSA